MDEREVEEGDCLGLSEGDATAELAEEEGTESIVTVLRRAAA
jgi:hypothetical protein